MTQPSNWRPTQDDPGLIVVCPTGPDVYRGDGITADQNKHGALEVRSPGCRIMYPAGQWSKFIEAKRGK